MTGRSLPGWRLMDFVGVFNVGFGATTEDGVVGCVDSASDGALEVVGVADSADSRAGVGVSEV